MKVSVIIPTYKDSDRIRLCVKALNRQTYPLNKFEVIVVNNDPLRPLKLDFNPDLNLKIVNETKPGSYAARNTGIKHAKGKTLAFTDSDCIPDKDWLKNALCLFHDKTVSMIGGKVDIFSERGVNNLTYIYEKFTAFNQKINVQKGISVTANLIIKKSMIDEIGVFNGALRSGGDAEFTRRATQSGYKLVYGENVLVKHPARANLLQLLKKEVRVSVGLYNREKRGKRLRLVLKSLVLIPYGTAVSIRSVDTGISNMLIVAYVSFLKHIIRFCVQLGLFLKILNPNGIR